MSPATNKTPISSSFAPPPSAYLSSAIAAPLAGLVYASGSCGIKDGKFVEGTVKDRTIQALKNVEALLKEAGLGLEDGERSLSCIDVLSEGRERSGRGAKEGRTEGGTENPGGRAHLRSRKEHRRDLLGSQDFACRVFRVLVSIGFDG